MAEEQSGQAAYVGRPSVCRSCGALVGAGEHVCAVCGAALSSGAAAPAAASRPDPETMRFARAVLTRPATFTFVFLTINVFVFLLMQLFSLPGGTENVEVLREYGAKYNTLINQGEWWRLVTPVFIHIGWLHLLVNMYSLFALGPYVERLYGSARFVCFWIATGVAGVLASYLASSSGHQPVGVLGRFLFRGGDGPSAGASGALFGLIGVLFVFGIKFRHELPDGFKRAFGLGMLPTILINLFIGYTIPMIDNAAHLGGFLAGCALALGVGYKRPGAQGPVAVAWHGLQVACLALVVVSFGQVARHMGDARPRFNQPGRRVLHNELPIATYIEAMNAAQRAFPDTLDHVDQNKLNAAINRLAAVPNFDPQADALRVELQSLLARARDMGAGPAAQRAAPRVQAQQVRQLGTDYQAWEQRFDQWVQTGGQQYGLVLTEPEETQTPAAPPPAPPPTPAPRTQPPAAK